MWMKVRHKVIFLLVFIISTKVIDPYILFSFRNYFQTMLLACTCIIAKYSSKMYVKLLAAYRLFHQIKRIMSLEQMQ